MTTSNLAFGRRVVWRGLAAVIVDIQWGHNVRAQIKVPGGYLHWVSPVELQEVTR